MPASPVIAAAEPPPSDADSDAFGVEEHFDRQAASRRFLSQHPSEDDWIQTLLSLPRPALSSCRSRSPRRTTCKSRPQHPAKGGTSSARPSCSAGADVPFRMFDSFEQLQSHLAARGACLPSARWAPPAQNTIVKCRGETQDHSRAASGAVCFKSPLSKCLWRIGTWMQALDNIAAFKVGIAFDPAHRWRNDEFGYVHEKMWMFMDVMHSGSANECRSLEKDLIESVRRLPGCYNTSPGGEGVRSATPGTCYCYVVYAPAGSGVGVHAAWRQREDWVTGANDCSCT